MIFKTLSLCFLAPFKFMRLRHKLFRRLVLVMLALMTALACLVTSPILGRMPASLAQTPPEALLDQGRSLYEAGQFTEASSVLQQAAETYQAQGNPLEAAVAFRNLALVYQQLGAWNEANQAIATSLDLLSASDEPSSTTSPAPNQGAALAQTLELQGSLQLAQGQSQAALETWEQAGILYEQLDDQAGKQRNQFNQAQALQGLGLYRRAIALLVELRNSFIDQPDSPLEAITLKTLGDAFKITGNLEQAQAFLEESLATAERLQLPVAIASAQLSLGNTVRFQQNSAAALNYYQQAERSPDALTRTNAVLNRFSLLSDLQRWDEALALMDQILPQLEALPMDQDAIFAHINFAKSLIRLTDSSQFTTTFPTKDTELITLAAEILAEAKQEAQQIQDSRAESYALGSLGELYERTQQWATAEDLTQQSLALAQSINAADIVYRWQWQMGRLLKAQNKPEEAIAAYTEAVNTLQSLRSDLVAVNREVQFSFQTGIEPVYRQLVELLLESGTTPEPSQKRLAQARTVIEKLQVAELDNFFREACLEAQFQLDQVVDQAGAPAALFYPIILGDRLEVILKLSQQDELIHYSFPVSRNRVESSLALLRQQLVRPYSFRQVESLGKEVYDWLIAPVASTLAEHGTETLVFVLDGPFRNVPMSVLFDGKQYLVEKYSIALAPGLQLTNPQPLPDSNLRVLIAGLSEARHGFSQLSYVANEVDTIQDEVSSVVLFNQDFTATAFRNEMQASPFSVVHIATHGQFSSTAADTFILAWDNPINVNEINSLLRSRDVSSPEPIELLVLSACQTAIGDQQAALGLAGVAVRAGARSTLASLWNLDDESASFLMNQFYQELTETSVSRAEALRQAQLKLLEQPLYRHPRYWAPYVLLGNWL